MVMMMMDVEAVLCRVGWLPYMAMKRPAASPTSPNTKARVVKLRKEAEKKRRVVVLEVCAEQGSVGRSKDLSNLCGGSPSSRG